MKKTFFILQNRNLLCILFLILVTLESQIAFALPKISKNNENEVRTNIEHNWKNASLGAVFWGDRIGYNDYRKLAKAVVTSITDRDFESLKEFLGDKAENMVAKMHQHTAEFDEEMLRDLLLRAFMSNGTKIQEGRLEISAGLARVDHWQEVTVDIPKLRKCKWRVHGSVSRYLPGDWGSWETDGICTETNRQTARVDMPPKFLPYLRYRIKDFPSLDISKIVKRIEKSLADARLVSINLPIAINSPAPPEIDTIVARELRTILAETFPQIPASSIASVITEFILPTISENRNKIYIAAASGKLKTILQDLAEEARVRVIEKISTYPGTLVFDWAHSNRAEKRRELAKGKWQLIWGVNIDEVEYIEFSTAVIGSVVSGGASLAIYFTDYLNRTVEKIHKQLPDIDHETLLRTISKALDDAVNGRTSEIKLGKLEISAGIATYDRWLEFDFPTIAKWPPPKCEIVRVPGTDISLEGHCVRISMQTFKSNLPNHHQPYIKIRYSDGSRLSPIDNLPYAPSDRVYLPHGRDTSTWQPNDTPTKCNDPASRRIVINGESPSSWEDAVNAALSQVVIPLKGLQVGKVLDQQFLIQEGTVGVYRISVEIEVRQDECFPNTIRNWRPPSRVMSMSLDRGAGGKLGCVVNQRGIIDCFQENSSADEVKLPSDLRAKQVTIESGLRLCVIDIDNRVRCWGEIGYYPGIDAITDVPEPLFAKFITSSFSHTCVIRLDDSVYCWGFNSFGASSPPKDLRAKKLALGEYLSCAITLEDKVRCWGGIKNLNINSPTNTTVLDIDPNNSSAVCEVDTNNSVRCWSIPPERGETTVLKVPMGLKAKQVVMGNLYWACAIRMDDTIQCWDTTCEENFSNPEECRVIRPDIPNNYKAYLISTGGNIAELCAVDFDNKILCWSSYGEASEFNEIIPTHYQ